MNWIDLHTHTYASGHAYSTLIENAKAAKEKGIQILGISDHAPRLPGSTHIFYFQNLKVVPEYIEGVRILKGAEVNILDDQGTIDLEPFVTKELDYCIASIHPPCFVAGTVESHTQAYLGAMKHPKVRILGHIDDARFLPDYETVVKAAKACNCLIEINNASLHPQSFRKDARKNVKVILDYCKTYEVSVIMSSDAHIAFSVGDISYAEQAIKEADFPEHLIVNYDVDRLWRFM